MSIYAVARVFGADKKLVGFALVDAESKEFKMVATNQLYEYMRNRIVEIENLEISDNEIKGSNGDVNRLPIIDVKGRLMSKNVLTIVRAYSTDGKITEFDVANSQGMIVKSPYLYILGHAKSEGVSNAKVVPKEDGSEYLSAIKGTFPTIEKTTPMSIQTSLPQPPKDNAVEQRMQAQVDKAYETVLNNAFMRGFDQSNVRLFREEFAKALKPLEQKYGLEIQLSRSISYTHDRFPAKIEVFITGHGQTAGEMLFKKSAEALGLEPSDFGKQFTFRGKTYQISDCKPTATKYNILARRLDNGEEYGFTAKFIKQLLGR